MTSLRKILVMTDGRAGNENQALGLAEALKRHLAPAVVDIAIMRLSLRSWAQKLPASALYWLGRLQGQGWLQAALKPGHDFDPAAMPDLVIGAGRRSAPFVAAMGKAGTKTVQLLNPQMPLWAFDLVIAPQHDGLSGDSVLSTLGSLHRIDPKSLARQPLDPRIAVIPTPRLAVLIGGPSKSVRFEPADAQNLAAALKQWQQQGFTPIASASRRSSKALLAPIAQAIEQANGFLWDGTGDNPYFSLLSAADAVVVTADSVNMLSEAAMLGKPLYIAPLTKIAPKFQDFQAKLVAANNARPLQAAFEAGPAWQPTALNDITRAVEAVLAMVRTTHTTTR